MHVIKCLMSWKKVIKSIIMIALVSSSGIITISSYEKKKLKSYFSM